MTAAVTGTGDAGTGGFKVYELFSRHDLGWQDGFFCVLLLHVFPYLEFSACKAHHQGLVRGVVDSISPAFLFSMVLLCMGYYSSSCGSSLRRAIISPKYHGRVSRSIPMDWNLAISRAGTMFHAAADLCGSVCVGLWCMQRSVYGPRRALEAISIYTASWTRDSRPLFTACRAKGAGRHDDK